MNSRNPFTHEATEHDIYKPIKQAILAGVLRDEEEDDDEATAMEDCTAEAGVPFGGDLGARVDRRPPKAETWPPTFSSEV